MDNEDDVRRARIEEYDVLGPPSRRDLQALVALAAQVCDVPRASIDLITDGKQVQVAAVGMGAGAIGDVPFHATQQLVTPEGLVIGALCVFDDVPRELDDSQRTALLSLADRVVDVLELGRRTRQLERSLAELTAARDELHRSNDLLGAFAAQAAHDLRNPLTSVSMALEMLGERETVRSDEDASWMLQRARSGAERMDRMITELLDYGRVGGALRLGDVDLSSLVEEVRHDLAGQLQEADLVVADLPVVRGDATQLRTVLQNLVANAVRFSRPVARPRVSVSAAPAAEGWRIEVSDNGPGVPPEQRHRVFEPLVQGDDRNGEGIGLGLAICARVLAAHGGSMGIEGPPGGGALVWFELPDASPATRQSSSPEGR